MFVSSFDVCVCVCVWGGGGISFIMCAFVYNILCMSLILYVCMYVYSHPGHCV